MESNTLFATTILIQGDDNAREKFSSNAGILDKTLNCLSLFIFENPKSSLYDEMCLLWGKNVTIQRVGKNNSIQMHRMWFKR
jgi:hypothetical protein